MNVAAVSHPGDEVQRLLSERGFSSLPNQAKHVGIHPQELLEIYDRGAVTPTQAFRLAQALGTSAVVWLNLSKEFTEANPIIPFPATGTPFPDRSEELTDALWQQLQSASEAAGSDIQAMQDTVISLGEGNYPGDIGLAALTAIALRSDHSLFASSAVQALTRFDEESATVAAYANTLRGSDEFRAQALMDLHGASPAMALERAHELLSGGELSVTLSDAARNVVMLCKALFPEFKQKPGEPAGIWEKRVCALISEEIKSGTAEFIIRQPEPDFYRNLACKALDDCQMAQNFKQLCQARR